MKELSKQNELSHDLGLLQEECAEIIQMVNKCRRFGLNEIYNGQENTLTNLQRLKGEVIDMLTILQALEDYHGLDIGFNDNLDRDIAISGKIFKVAKYKKYSRELGLLED
jgi:NTP pyrophosphatase (non-canonical NTP hydrolase)